MPSRQIEEVKRLYRNWVGAMAANPEMPLDEWGNCHAFFALAFKMKLDRLLDETLHFIPSSCADNPNCALCSASAWNGGAIPRCARW